MPTDNVIFLPDHIRTGMIIPKSKETFFNIKTTSHREVPCAYDMVFHPPDYNPKAARSDRQEPQIIKNNIWRQELPKPLSSTNHFMYGRPYWTIHDKPDKKHNIVVVKSQRECMRIYHVLEWAVLLTEGKPTCVDA